MEGSAAKKSTSLETLVIQNISNVNDLKMKLNDIIQTGKDYDFDVSSCIRSLLNNSDQDIVLLSVQAISELVKCEDKRETYAHNDIIEPILKILNKEVTLEKLELIKQCFRALGNLCCDCDTSRKIILHNNGVATMKKVLDKSVDLSLHYIKLLACKTLLNFGIGGQEFCEAIVKECIPEVLHRILITELEKPDFDDDMVSTSLLILSVLNDNIPEILQSDDINRDVLNILKETTNVEISETCLEHLHAQAEHDSVKNLIANEGGVQLVCSRLEQLMLRQEAGELSADDAEVEAIVKQACDLIVIVLTGDEPMHTLYKHGFGEVYQTMVKWLESSNNHLLTTAVLAIGNFARQDDYCVQMMENKIYDKLLDIFEKYSPGVGTESSVGVCTAALGALRNLSVPATNKRAAPPRAARLLLAALPALTDHHLAYKLMAALRMLLHKQPGVARLVAGSAGALQGACAWGAAGGAGAAGEAPRLLAWTARELTHDPLLTNLVQVEGCIACIINMLLTSHSLMQNEAILALTLLAIESLKTHSPDCEPEFDYEMSFTTQLIKSEIGKHVAVLVDTNCAKMPIEVAENLMAFLEITTKKNEICHDYKEAKVHDSLKKFSEVRKDLSDDLKVCIAAIINAISNDNED